MLSFWKVIIWIVCIPYQIIALLLSIIVNILFLVGYILASPHFLLNYLFSLSEKIEKLPNNNTLDEASIEVQKNIERLSQNCFGMIEKLNLQHQEEYTSLSNENDMLRNLLREKAIEVDKLNLVNHYEIKEKYYEKLFQFLNSPNFLMFALSIPILFILHSLLHSILHTNLVKDLLAYFFGMEELKIQSQQQKLLHEESMRRMQTENDLNQVVLKNNDDGNARSRALEVNTPNVAVRSVSLFPQNCYRRLCQDLNLTEVDLGKLNIGRLKDEFQKRQGRIKIMGYGVAGLCLEFHRESGRNYYKVDKENGGLRLVEEMKKAPSTFLREKNFDDQILLDK
jgi:hypothetical protein